MQPESQLATGIGQAEEHLDVQALVAQSPIEALNVAVLDRPSLPDEIQVHSVCVCPLVHGLTGELGPVINGDRLRRPAAGKDLIQRCCDLISTQCCVRVKRQALARVLVNDSQYADPATVGKTLSQ